MKSKVISNCKHVYEILIEKIMEFTDYLKFKFKRQDEYRSNLVEVYNISKKYINEEYVQEFLKERQKCVGPNRYKIEIRTYDNEESEEKIGEVVLSRKKKIIEKATLVIKRNIPDSEKLIYWKF
ncbi:MAG: hypothetical protein J6V20_00340 [Bacteroidaceae bacterium]|jgi:hypothetical protein|nr:hypothetical protein [Bacteroidaceae bacterium]